MATQKNLSTVHVVNAEPVASVRSHALEMREMKQHMSEVVKSREQSIAFLKRAGLLTPTGKVKQLVRA
jgi:2-iminoacetate synthase ThiH